MPCHKFHRHYQTHHSIKSIQYSRNESEKRNHKVSTQEFFTNTHSKQNQSQVTHKIQVWAMPNLIRVKGQPFIVTCNCFAHQVCKREHSSSQGPQISKWAHLFLPPLSPIVHLVLAMNLTRILCLRGAVKQLVPSTVPCCHSQFPKEEGIYPRLSHPILVLFGHSQWIPVQLWYAS